MMELKTPRNTETTVAFEKFNYDFGFERSDGFEEKNVRLIDGAICIWG